MTSTKTKVDGVNEAQAATAAKGEADRRNVMGAGLAALIGFVVAGCDDDEPLKAAGSAGTSGKGGSSAAGSGGSAGSSAGGSAGSTAGGTGGVAGAAGKGGTAGASGSTAAGSAGAAGSSTGVDADVAKLNALLTAEYQAITAYTAGAGILEKPGAADPLKDLAPTLLATASAFLAQHKLHAEALVTQITTLKGTPVDAQKVGDDFLANPSADLTALLGNTTILNLLKFATKAELAAAIAYTETVGSLEAAKTRLLATSIGGDESQHFIVLAALALGLAAPTAALTKDNAGGAVPFPFVAKIDDKHTGFEKYTPFWA
jgi:bacterioferritin (cytochrome b1)